MEQFEQSFHNISYDPKLLSGKKRLHFVGIGGSGMFPLVQILHAAGYTITGSDVLEGDIIQYERQLGIFVSIPHAAENVEGRTWSSTRQPFCRATPSLPGPANWVFLWWSAALCWGMCSACTRIPSA